MTQIVVFLLKVDSLLFSRTEINHTFADSFIMFSKKAPGVVKVKELTYLGLE